MRITRDALMKIVRETVAMRVQTDRSLISIYLCGSLLGEDYLLGGAADIDLVFVHTDEVEKDREIVPLTDTVHLDIAHHLYKDYRQTRRLRVHPWMGPTLNVCQVLHDPQHFLDFTQASVRGQFASPEHVIERARGGAVHARQIWTGYHLKQVEPGPKEISDYLRALDHAVNSVVLLTGFPLTERRFLLDLGKRAEAVGRPGLAAGLVGLLGGTKVDAGMIKNWLPAWEAAYAAVPQTNDMARLHPARRSYYMDAFKAMLEGSNPQAVLWPLIRTWTFAVRALPAGTLEIEGWRSALNELGLLGDGFEERIEALDSYLDTIEERLDSWAHQMGITE